MALHGAPDLAESYDAIVIGAGCGGMTAAAVAAAEGVETLVIEKTGLIGGTTAYSGGMAWMPNTAKAAEVGAEDSIETAEGYLDATLATEKGRELRRLFLERAGEALDYLERRTEVRMMPLAFYPDYYPDAEGATTKGRILEPVPFDGRELGAGFRLLRPPLPEFTLFGGMMIARPDIPHFRKVFRSPRSAARVLRLTLGYVLERLSQPRGTSLVLGNALVARLFRSLQRLGVPVLLEAGVERLIHEEGAVRGVVLATPDGLRRIGARRGVVLATGGFPHDPEMRAAYLPTEASPFSASAEGCSGDGLALGLQAGGAVPDDDGNDGYWAPVSRFRRADGTYAIYPHTVTDRGKPGFLAVNAEGRRFTNEANSYHQVVKGMFEPLGNRCSTPAHLICDSRALWSYGLGAVKPMRIGLRAHLRSGYVKEARDLRELAARIGVDPDALAETVALYNRDAAEGVDTLFGRGSNAYHRYTGDPEHEPNPCMRPLDTPPFYAVEIHAGTLGTAAGLRTDGNGAVLGRDGAPLAGLYACGNDMSSIMAGGYPGPGITLGPALVFGYLVGRHLAREPVGAADDGPATGERGGPA